MEFNKFMKFVPASSLPLTEHIHDFVKFISSCNKLLLLTGAGISTESGIPDYRSENVGLYARKRSGPMSYQTFLKSHENRQRYWARNYIGWPLFSSIQPNIVHDLILKWENNGRIFYTISQNVDNLHKKSGLKKLVELHGNTHSVVCIDCNYQISRHHLQEIFNEMNPYFKSEINQNNIVPDGDFVLDDELIKLFHHPDCFKCKGILKPDIIFFGDNLPRNRKEFVQSLVANCDGLLCLGTSLEVYSSYSIAKQAFDRHVPVGIINIGSTRADNLTSFRLKGQLGYVIPKLDEMLS
nr:sirtuin-4-like protein [Dugesia japonica]